MTLSKVYVGPVTPLSKKDSGWASSCELVYEESPASHRVFHQKTSYHLPFPWIYYVLGIFRPGLKASSYLKKYQLVSVRMAWGISQCKSLTDPVYGQPMTNAFGTGPCFQFGTVRGEHMFPLGYSPDEIFAQVYRSWWSGWHQNDGWLSACSSQPDFIAAVCNAELDPFKPFIKDADQIIQISPRVYYAHWQDLSPLEFRRLCKKRLIKHNSLSSLLQHPRSGSWKRTRFVAPTQKQPYVDATA